MTKLLQVATTCSLLSPSGAAVLLLSLSAACGGGAASSAVDGGGSAEGGSTTDGGNTSEGGPGLADARTPTDSGASGDSGDAGDGRAPLSQSKLAVDLGAAGGYVILAKSGISTVPPSVIRGNLGVSPAAADALTGFSLTADATDTFSTSLQVTGSVFAADYTQPTPARLTTAIGDMERAFTDAAGRAPDVTELGAGDIGGKTLVPGIYKWGTGLDIPTDVTLAGSATGVWIFQIAQNLTMASAKNVFLTGGALAKNVFWQVAGSVAIGTTAHIEGIILTQTSIALDTGASITGRLLAQTAVTLDTSRVREP